MRGIYNNLVEWIKGSVLFKLFSVGKVVDRQLNKLDPNTISFILANLDGTKTEMELLQWLGNFEEEDRTNAVKILQKLVFVGQKELYFRTNELVEKVENIVAKESHIYFLPIAKYGKSATMLSYYFKKSGVFQKMERDGRATFLVTDQQIMDCKFNGSCALVFFDDFLGTGGSFAEYYAKVMSLSANKIERLQTFVSALHFMPAAAEKIRRVVPHAQIDGHLHEPIFGSAPLFWTDKSERDLLQKLATEYFTSKKLWSNKHALGFEGSQAIIGFAYLPPNNTLPIIWSSKNQWWPLLPRDYQFILEDYERDRQGVMHAASLMNLEIPTGFSLYHNYPKNKYILANILLMIEKKIAEPVIARSLGVNVDMLDKFIAVGQVMDFLDDEHDLTYQGREELEDVKREIQKFKNNKSKKVKFVKKDNYVPKDFSRV